jgi:L-cysteate sulfo-lyase
VTEDPFDALRALPRVDLVGAPTVISRLERFERAIGSRHAIFIKRDDAIPFGFGGNKVRKLELVMAEALAQGADAVITCGGVQSNHARATAAAAARFGLHCHLVLSGARSEKPTGNTRLDALFGARLLFVADRNQRAPAMEALATELRAEGRRPVIIPLGASTPLGAAGFALAIEELRAQGHKSDVIVHASSSGGTQAGLLAGLALLGSSTRVIGVSADESSAALGGIVDDLARGVLRLAHATVDLASAEVTDAFVGDGYGVPTEASTEAQRLLATTEAIVVDHTYTAKALAGLVALVRGGELRDGAAILFWHTGGQVGALA